MGMPVAMTWTSRLTKWRGLGDFHFRLREIIQVPLVWRNGGWDKERKWTSFSQVLMTSGPLPHRKKHMPSQHGVDYVFISAFHLHEPFLFRYVAFSFICGVRPKHHSCEVEVERWQHRLILSGKCSYS